MGLALLAAEGGSFTDLKVSTAIWAWVAFLTTFFILSKVAWPGLAAKMEARELRIAEGLKAAEEAEARAREIAEKQEQLLGEVEDLLRTMPSRVTMRQETGENFRWMGRLSAVISGWSTPHAIMLRGYLIQFNSHVAQLHDVGFNERQLAA